MVRPAHRRAVRDVGPARTSRVSERRACHATGVGRSLIRYRVSGPVMSRSVHCCTSSPTRGRAGATGSCTCCLALEGASTFRGSGVAQRLAVCGRDRGQLPTHISLDNGTEFTSKTLDVGVTGITCSSTSVGPGDRAIIRSSKASTRARDASASRSIDLSTSRTPDVTLDRWKEDDNNARPHTSLAKRTPTDQSLVDCQGAN